MWAEVAVTAGVAVSVASIVLVPVLVARLPEDYFVEVAAPPPPWMDRHPALRLSLRIARSAVGALLVVAGLAMLVLPGQGLLTLFAGLILLEFPGKRRAERALVRRERVRRGLDWVRARAGRGPLQPPED